MTVRLRTLYSRFDLTLIHVDGLNTRNIVLLAGPQMNSYYFGLHPLFNQFYVIEFQFSSSMLPMLLPTGSLCIPYLWPSLLSLRKICSLKLEHWLISVLWFRLYSLGFWDVGDEVVDIKCIGFYFVYRLVLIVLLVPWGIYALLVLTGCTFTSK